MLAYSIVILSDSDSAAAHQLYSICAASSPAGFLARRSQRDLESLLTNPQDAIAVGAWERDSLVAYSICHRIRHNPYPEVKILQALNPQIETIYQGDGTVVHPSHRGRLLMQRLYRMR